MLPGVRLTYVTWNAQRNIKDYYMQNKYVAPQLSAGYTVYLES